MTSSNSKNDKVTVSYRSLESKLPRSRVIDIGVGPNLLPEFLVKPNWLLSNCVRDVVQLDSAAKEPDRVVEIVLLRFQIEESPLRIMYGMIENLTSPMLLGTLRMNIFIRLIFST